MDQSTQAGPRTRFLARAMLPFGLAYLAFAALYFGYHIANGRFGAFEAVYALFAVTTSIFLIVQGRRFRRDARFR